MSPAVALQSVELATHGLVQLVKASSGLATQFRAALSQPHPDPARQIDRVTGLLAQIRAASAVSEELCKQGLDVLRQSHKSAGVPA